MQSQPPQEQTTAREHVRGLFEMLAVWAIVPLRRLTTLNYYKLHLLYFITIGVIGSLIIFGIESGRMAYIDAFFMAFSAVTQTGLTTVDMSNVRVGTQVLIVILVFLGSGILLTLPIPLIRQHYLRKAYRDAKRWNDLKSLRVDPEGRSGDNTPQLGAQTPQMNTSDNNNHENASNYNDNDSEQGGASGASTSHPTDKVSSNDNEEMHDITKEDMIDIVPEGPASAGNFSLNGDETVKPENTRGGRVKPSAVRNKRFHLVVYENLEYRALKRIVLIVVGYYFSVIAVSFIVMGIYLSAHASSRAIINAQHVDGWWEAFFLSVCAMGNAGFTTLKDNFEPFVHDHWMLFQVSLLVALGNTAFPIVLRGIVLAASKLTKDPEPYYQLLDNPRLVYTHLFDSLQTRLLALSWVVVTFVQFLLFAWLDWGNHQLSNLSGSDKFWNAWFLSVNTRVGGFNSFNLPLLSVGLLVLVVVCMYLSAYPFIISLRGSSMQGEYSALAENNVGLETSRVIARDLLIREIAWIYVAILLICIIEDADWDDVEGTTFSVFKVIFEVVSAYGTVGLSLGYPGLASSFSGGLKPLSKLVIVAVMLFGRHRGLPESVDSAVNLSEVAPKSSILRKIGVVPRELVSTGLLRTNPVFRHYHADNDADVDPAAFDRARGNEGLRRRGTSAESSPAVFSLGSPSAMSPAMGAGVGGGSGAMHVEMVASVGSDAQGASRYRAQANRDFTLNGEARNDHYANADHNDAQ